MDGRKRALVVGINAYSRGVPSLGSAVRDAEVVAEQLEQAHGFDVDLLRDDEATSETFMASLVRVAEEGLSEDSSFLLYYAGHGIAADDRDGSGPQGFLLAHDAHLTDQDTWIGMESLRGALDDMVCRHLMLVLDCCYAGAFQWASTRAVTAAKRPLYKSQYERYRNGTAWQVLTSASYDEKADDSAPITPDRGGAASPEGHSPFAQALIEGLSGNAADSSRAGMQADGVITATELYQFIYEKVAVDDRQTPGIFPLKHDNKGEFVFLAPGTELNLEPDPPLDDANNPWLGHDAYTAADRDLFFGREQATEELLATVESRRFVVVVGDSGAGKSSLVRAGLIPELEAAEWVVVETVGLAADPLDELRRVRAELASAPAGARRLLVIDQFEELLTHADETLRASALDEVRESVAADDGAHVVIAVRSDHEPEAATALSSIWGDQTRFEITPFSAGELRHVAVGPARSKAVFFEPAEIVDDLVQAVTDMPGAAPLLSLTLSELYCAAQARRRITGTLDRMISTDDVDAVGGVAEVVHRQARELYEAADGDAKAAMQRVFPRLVDQKPDGLVRRRVDRDELRFGPEHDQAVDDVIGSFVAARLLTVGGDDGREYVEAAHDDLVTSWRTQLRWLAQSGSQEVIRDLWSVAGRWKDDDKKPRSKHLWNQDPRLAQLERHDRNGELNALEREFRAVSHTRHRRLARTRRIAVIALAVLTVTALGAGAYALRKRSEALDQRSEALFQRSEAVREAERASSHALASDALNNVTTQTDLAALLALESVRVANTADARGSLAGVLSLPTRFLQRSQEHEDEITAIAFSDNGRIAATGDDSGVITMWDVNENPFVSPQATQVGDAIETDLSIRHLFVTDESMVLVVDDEGFLMLLDVPNAQFDELDPPEEFIAATLSSDFDMLAGFTADGVLRVYSIEDDLGFRELPTLDVEPDEVTDLVFSPDGSMLAWGDGSLFHLWQWADGGEPDILDAGGGIAAIAFSPDDEQSQAVVAVGLEAGLIFLIDRNDRSFVNLIDPTPVNQLFDLAFKPDVADLGDGDVAFALASTHSNGDVNLFDVFPGDGFAPIGFGVETMLGHNDEAKKVAFAPDGRIASGDFSGEIVWWLDEPVSALGDRRPTVSDVGLADAAFVTPTQALSLNFELTAWLTDLDSDENNAIVEELRVMAVDAADDAIAVGMADGSAAVLTPDGTVMHSLDANHELFVEFVGLSSDGRRLATVSPWDEAGFRGHLALWDVTTGTLSSERDLPDGFEPFSVLFADDDVVWIGGRDIDDLPIVLEIDATTGDTVGVIRHSSRSGNGVTALAISDDGRTLATGAMDRRISLWDTDTRVSKPGGEFTGHRGNVTGLAFWDGGQTLISADDAGDVLMWNVSDRRQFARLGGPTDDVMSLEVDAGSSTLLASSEDGRLWTWSLDPEEWRDRACQLAGRNMTAAEWELYGDGGTKVRHCVEFEAPAGAVRDAEYGEALTD